LYKNNSATATSLSQGGFVVMKKIEIGLLNQKQTSSCCSSSIKTLGAKTVQYTCADSN